ncbi:MAG: hypothetical protein ACR2JU_00180 [Nocardioidaceae bacterium]
MTSTADRLSVAASPPLLDGVEAALLLRAEMRAGARRAELYVEERDAETVRLDGGSPASPRGGA